MFCPACRSEYPADWKACPKDATLLLSSAYIGKYSIEGLLGVGGMGAVYRATNPDTKGRVAVKVMHPAVAGAEQMRARFQREAAAVAALRTSHVVKVYDFGTEPDGTLYLVMELLDGHSLRDEIAPAPDHMDLARVQMVMDGALKGLAAAHKAGIVHRDLKPENIFVADTDDGEVPKLLDFGIARVRTRDSDLTRTGSLMGTASYMAPEQIAASFGEIGPWSDVYAMGAILYEMLAGTAAVGGDTVTDVLHRVLRGEIVPLPTVRSGLPESAYALVARCTSPSPAERPQDAEQLRAALAQAQLVPPGTIVPPAHRTRPHDHLALAHTGAASSSDDSIIHAPTQASVPPQPAPQPPATVPPIADERRHRSKAPLIIGGLALAAIAAVVAVKALASEERPAPVAASATDAGVAVIVNDAAATIELEIDAAALAVPDPNEGMVKIAAGTYVIGAPKIRIPEPLPKTTAVVRELWIDRGEMTVGVLRSALGDKLPAALAAKLANDADTLPARYVDHATATAACGALGKRLPSEVEWEIAARTTPQDPKRARLNVTGKDADLTAAVTDCSGAGLCDMLGGLLEWTADDWPKAKRGEKVARGASYRTPMDGHLDTIHARHKLLPTTSDNEVGFRCASGDVTTTEIAATSPKPASPPATPAPKPPTSPSPPPPPPAAPVDKCDVHAMKEKAKQRYTEGLYAAALQVATNAIERCGAKDAATVSIAAMAACSLKRPEIARRFLAMLPPPRAAQVRTICLKNGVEP